MSNLIELSFDSQELFPVRFDLFSRTLPAWNHLLIEKNDAARFMYFSSLIQANIAAHGKKHLIKGIVWKENPEVIKLANNCSATIVKSSNLKVNLLKQLPISFDSIFMNEAVKQEAIRLIRIHAIDYSDPNPHGINKFIQSHDFNLLSEEIKSEFKELLNNFYLTNSQITNFIVFLETLLDIPTSPRIRDLIYLAGNFLVKGQELTFDSLMYACQYVNELDILTKLENFKNSIEFNQLFFTEDVYTSQSKILIVDSRPTYINTIIMSFLIESDIDLANNLNCLRIFFYDSLIQNIKNQELLDVVIMNFRSARKRGISNILTESFLPELNSPELRALISNFQSYSFGNIQGQAKYILDEFALKDSISVQALDHNYGISYTKRKEKQISALYLNEVYSYGSFKDKEISYGQALLLNKDVTKIKQIKNRFIDYIVNNEIGIFSLDSDLLPNDLGYIDNEMKKMNIKQLILILKNHDLDEYSIYNDYGYKKCKNKIIIKSARDFYNEVEEEMNKTRRKLQSVYKREQILDGKLLILTEDLTLL